MTDRAPCPFCGARYPGPDCCAASRMMTARDEAVRERDEARADVAGLLRTIEDLKADIKAAEELEDAHEVILSDKNEDLDAALAIVKAAKALDWNGILAGIDWGQDQSVSPAVTARWEALETEVKTFMALLGVRDTRLG